MERLSMNGGTLLDTTSTCRRCTPDRYGTDDRSCYFAGDRHYFYPGLEPLSAVQAAALPGGFPGTVSWFPALPEYALIVQEAPDGKVYADTIKEVKDGKVIWEWKVSEKLDPKRFPLQQYPREHWPLINGI